METVSRRTFLPGAIAGGVSVGVTSRRAGAAKRRVPLRRLEARVVVIGSGGGGNGEGDGRDPVNVTGVALSPDGRWQVFVDRIDERGRVLEQRIVTAAALIMAAGVCDLAGRVLGHRGLYVLDGALMPGNTAACNPSASCSDGISLDRRE